ncbi:Sec-independent protein translocase protein TatB [uncultured Lamprocystis sp.]|jgi:sec-independent protein translocase protein TatB|uniref:Sec-independent protein translocase protein TatB n=1 Tax=uncultured Lamprocystis sp. TaxID=543132 RepID=UPI0025F7756F|nr:Sec-independent protein translocase protein TatB [uncultured Lamprocystis sp.]
MFDIGFWELVLVGVVALVVIGPERLPKAARMAGLWVGRARRTLSSVKEEIDREFKAQELQDILNKQARRNPLETLIEEPRPAARSRPADVTPTPAPVSAGAVETAKPNADQAAG